MAPDPRASPALLAALAPRMATSTCNTEKMEPGTPGCQGRRYCTRGLARYITGKLAIGKSVGGLPGNRRASSSCESPGRTGDPCKISDEAVSTRM